MASEWDENVIRILLLYNIIIIEMIITVLLSKKKNKNIIIRRSTLYFSENLLHRHGKRINVSKMQSKQQYKCDII